MLHRSPSFSVVSLFLSTLALFCIHSSASNVKSVVEVFKSQTMSRGRRFCTVGLSTMATTVKLGRADEILPTDVREKVARKASKLPGLGVPDVYYPMLYLGGWDVQETISSYDDTALINTDSDIKFALFSAFKNYAVENKPVQYRSFYIPTEDGIVLDRAATTASLTNALFNSNSDANVQWSRQNPNLLTIDDSYGQTVEFKVTKRSTEILGNTFDEGAIGYSEFSRVACVNKKSLQYAVPSLYAMRILVRYKPAPDMDSIDGVVRRYLYSSDTIDMGKPVPLVTVKSKVRMKRMRV